MGRDKSDKRLFSIDCAICSIRYFCNHIGNLLRVFMVQFFFVFSLIMCTALVTGDR